jgi:hypothetical protein
MPSHTGHIERYARIRWHDSRSTPNFDFEISWDVSARKIDNKMDLRKIGCECGRCLDLTSSGGFWYYLVLELLNPHVLLIQDQ